MSFRKDHLTWSSFLGQYFPIRFTWVRYWSPPVSGITWVAFDRCFVSGLRWWTRCPKQSNNQNRNGSYWVSQDKINTVLFSLLNPHRCVLPLILALPQKSHIASESEVFWFVFSSCDFVDRPAFSGQTKRSTKSHELNTKRKRPQRRRVSSEA